VTLFAATSFADLAVVAVLPTADEDLHGIGAFAG
jgi:hypothetical protein